MQLSIITINRNNAKGLEKTMQSVASQSCKDLEYIVIDGASTDNSVDVIKNLESECANLKWVSEPDNGIYNAMNKGLRMASGEYVQILNSGDELASINVVERMLKALDEKDNPDILYGNMIKAFADGKRMRDCGFAGEVPTMYGFIHGTLNHDPVYIRRSLFDKFGYYREDLPITADWRWYVEAIPFGGVVPRYVDIDVTIFDMNGISETQIERREKERDEELQRILPIGVYKDYQNYCFPIEQVRRLQRHPLAYKLFYFVERVLFKLEKRKNRQQAN
jgi:glycosyltransferase involved in cell wall biosynthesis